MEDFTSALRNLSIAIFEKVKILRGKALAAAARSLVQMKHLKLNVAVSKAFVNDDYKADVNHDSHESTVVTDNEGEGRIPISQTQRGPVDEGESGPEGTFVDDGVDFPPDFRTQTASIPISQMQRGPVDEGESGPEGTFVDDGVDFPPDFRTQTASSKYLSLKSS